MPQPGFFDLDERMAFEEKGKMEAKTVKIDQIASVFDNI